jgi:hypothetical protein
VTDALRVVLDDTAMVAVGSGNVLASRLIHRAHATQGWFLYAPTCALVEAGRTRRGTAEDIVALPGIIVLDLDLPAALAVARDTGWAPAHIAHAAQPTPERPDGAVVATARHAREVERRPVRVLDLNP